MVSSHRNLFLMRSAQSLRIDAMIYKESTDDPQTPICA
jgi:hypothetical protein